jgi:NAD(P)-dependent dehydrogenase (short-subunit alcohol dehydrogenase family)
MSLTAAQEFAPWGIRTNAVFPGPTDTDMWSDSFSAEHQTASIARVPLGRLGTATEIANVILFLVGDEASYVNGASWAVHGGSVPT